MCVGGGVTDQHACGVDCTEGGLCVCVGGGGAEGVTDQHACGVDCTSLVNGSGAVLSQQQHVAASAAVAFCSLQLVTVQHGWLRCSIMQPVVILITAADKQMVYKACMWCMVVGSASSAVCS